MRKLLSALVGALILIGAALAQSPNFVQFGNIHMSTSGHAAPPLRIRSSGVSSLRSFRFVGRVGGVSFEQVAQPERSTPRITGIRYNEARPDGQRLQVSLSGQWLTVDAHDWEIAPIAEFADSEYHAAVSLFGEGPNPQQYYYIQYAEAFENTLLGLRLLHSDVLLIDPVNFSFLPSINQRTPLGGGEQPSNAHRNSNLSNQISRVLALQS